MHDHSNAQYETAMTRYLKARVTRSRFLAATGAGVVLAAAPSLAHAQATPESVQDIINIADTAEHLAVTVLTAAVGNASTLGLSGLLLAIVQAALAEEQYHADFLEANGAKSLTDTFTVPDPKILTDQKTFFHTLEAAETLFIGAYMAAVREFTALNQPILAKYAYQIGGVEAEHRALVRGGEALTGDTSGIPPNNRAFSSNVVMTVADAAAQLKTLGFIGGTGSAAMYPGRSAALAAAGAMAGAVTAQTPNTSSPTPLAAHLVAARRARVPEVPL